MTFTRREFAKATGLISAAVLAHPAAALGNAGGQRDSSRLIDPELTVADLDAMQVPKLTDQTLPEVRSWLNKTDFQEPLAAPSIAERMIPGPAGAPQVRILITGTKTADAPRPAVLYIHGGGFVLGAAWTDAVYCQKLAAELDCVVVSVDYRLAPETRFPGALEDNYAALRWLHDNAKALGVDPMRIAIMGVSGGGGHAAMLAIAARDRGEYPICCQVLIYPMLDDRTGSSIDPAPEIGRLVWLREHNRYGWSAHLGMPAGSPNPPKGSVPARVEHLAGLPPTFIGVGAIDLFVDENIAYAQRLVDSAVPTELIVLPGAYHSFDLIVPEARASKRFTSAWKGFLAKAFREPE